MEFMKGTTGKEGKEIAEMIQLLDGKAAETERCKEITVTTEGAVHRIRKMGELVFVILRKRDGILQTVCDPALPGMAGLKEEACVRVTGKLLAEERAPHGMEIRVTEVTILSVPEEALPFPVARWKMNASLETRLNRRALSLRNLRERAVFRIQEGIARAFRDYLHLQGFTEIHSPKIGSRGAEGGANMFRLSYFHRPAVLAQSPQFYKQIMAGVFERVMEIGPVFRAEKHNTKRHLNEYTGLDFEMAYIRDFSDLMQMETGLLQYAVKLLTEEYAEELRILEVTLPKAEEIPVVRFEEAKKLAAETYGRQIRAPYDLEPEEEQLIGAYFKEHYNADFVFVTHYPAKKRPFYAMDDPADEKYTLSFDLLCRGVEVTTGGQRIHEYTMLREKMVKRGIGEEGMEGYLEAFRCGMPPHGGLGIGLERLTMQLLGLTNVREACLFPRDVKRLEP